jgi:hypothetical protein
MQVTLWWKSKRIGFLCFAQAWNMPLPIAMVLWFFQFFEAQPDLTSSLAEGQ